VKRVFLLAAVLLSAAAHSGVVEQLYEADAPYDGSDRQAAFRAALAEVVVRVTGDRGSPGDPAVRELLARPDGYVQQFRPGDEPDTLWVSFDGQAVTTALKAAGQPVWGEERPTTLLWLAIDQGGGQRGVLSADAEGDDGVTAALRQRVEETAAQRGLPIVLPLMDAEDRRALSFADLWGGFDEAIARASLRYQTDAVLAGRISLSEADRGRWTRYSGNGATRWVGDTEEGLQRTADDYAAVFAVRVDQGSGQDILVRVHDVRDIPGYARTLEHLESLTAVRSVAVDRFEADRLTLRLTIAGSPASLDQALSLGSVLTVADSEAVSAGSPPGTLPSETRPDREYRLLP
jgi:hypothetical protein